MSYEPIFHVVLHQPEIPPNTGNAGRTCLAVRAKLWLVRPLGFEIDAKQLRRAGLDYWPHLEKEIVENWQELTNRLAGRRFWYFTKRGKHNYGEVPYQRGDVLVFGCETQGLPQELLANEEQTVVIPIHPPVRSLNLSSAVAVGVYAAQQKIL